MGCEEGSEKKEREKHKKEEILQEKLSENLCRKKNTKGKTSIASRHPVKATIAHTRIQRESNFASFEG